MVTLAHNHHPFSHPSLHPSLHSIDEDASPVLDSAILDDSTAEMAIPAFHQHNDSPYQASQAFFSTGQSTWQQFPSTPESASFHAINQHQNYYSEHIADPSHCADFATQTASWQQPQGNMGADSHPNYFPQYDSHPAVKDEEPTYQNDVAPLQPPSHGLPPPVATGQPHYAASATSPQSEAGWMSTSSSSERTPKREQMSPLFDHNPPCLRRDGVRKKNARFDIPDDRKVETIDKIIMEADPTDEKLIKELKAQKRLLRNRQAALDSRCRKKEHTSRLEDERKRLNSQLDQFQEELDVSRNAQSSLMQECQQWRLIVDRLSYEKEEMVRQHTLETAELRKKNAFLAEETQRRSSIPMSAVPSSTGYSSTYSDFDHLSMEPDSIPWNEFSLVNPVDSRPEMPKQDSALTVRPKGGKGVVKEDDKTAVSGLLLTLLLCGAWVASSNTNTPAVMPQMPEDVRVASAAVLDNLYKDAGLQSYHDAIPSAGNTGQVNQIPSQHSAQSMRNPSEDHFTSFSSQLALPSLQQQRDQAFALSTTQYNHITSDDEMFQMHDEAPRTPKFKKNLHEALVSLRPNKEGQTAESYTRSLLWDEVPTDVVRDFARMMSESRNHNSMYGNGEPLS